jgi:outer membrane lipoprotein-sorting protein
MTLIRGSRIGQSALWGLAGALVLLTACTSSAAETAPGSFYLEATVTVTGDEAGAHEEVITHLRWWSESVDRWRWELDQTGTDARSDGSFSLSDGDTVWYYDASANTYQRTEPFDLPEGAVAMPLPFSILFGPTNTPTLDDFIAQLEELGVDTEVVVAGHETVLGRETTVVEFRPTWHSSSASASAGDPTATPTEVTESGGVGRLWVDEERRFILRSEIDGEDFGQNALLEVTRLDFDPPMDGELFEFDPPPGAVEVTADGIGGTRSSGTSTSAD